MDAVKFLKELNRMCQEQEHCTGCPLEKSGMNIANCIISAGKTPEKAVEIVEDWSKENPPKTFLTDFLEKHPNAPLEVDGTPKVCIYILGYADDIVCATGNSCNTCWNTEMEEKGE